MIPNGMFDTFQPRIDFSYGLDVVIRLKLTPGAGTQVQYSTGQPATATATATGLWLWLWLWLWQVGDLAPSGLRSEKTRFSNGMAYNLKGQKFP